ncbi:hypothetical protein DB346_05615 [Verrucomicrobia bacterium LW23]|nr:hypothetical protein DB346_05615 [Verrucomicrobia bacterium LW23]
MIEIKLDGPLGPAAAGGFKNQVRILGVGHAGVAALDYIVVRGSGDCDMTVIDTDQQVLQASVVADKLLLGYELTRGLGCGGDLELAEEVAANCQEQFAQITDGAEYVLICTGLGGGTGSVFAPELVRHAHKHGAKVIVLASMPFAFQGRRLYCQALDCLARLRASADAVMVFANDRLSGVPSVAGNIRHGFHLLNQFAGRTLNSLAQVLSRHGFIQLTFADLRSLYGRLHGTEVIENCWAGCGEVAPDEQDISKLINQVIDSPLFADETAWRNADHAVVCLTGGRELSLSEIEDILAELQERLPSELPVAAGTHLDASGDGTLRMTLLLAATSAPVVEMLPGGEEIMPDEYGVDLQEVAMAESAISATPHASAASAGAPASAPGRSASLSSQPGMEFPAMYAQATGHQHVPTAAGAPGRSSHPATGVHGGSPVAPAHGVTDDVSHPLFGVEGEAHPTFTDSQRLPQYYPAAAAAAAQQPWQTRQGSPAPASVASQPVVAEYDAEAPVIPPLYQPASAPVASVAFTPHGAQRRSAAAPYVSHVTMTAAEPPVPYHEVNTATREVRSRFERADRTYYHGENLDQPTWRRRRIKLR